jgi:aldehyde dehydrogenase (NAD+)
MAIHSSEQSAADFVAPIFARQAAKRWELASRDAKARVKGLRTLRRLLRERRSQLCDAIRLDFGKHPLETELTEYLPSIEELSLAIRRLDRWMKPRRVGTPLPLLGSCSHIHYEARGQVLLLSPWNYPFLLAITPLISAHAAGNAVIMRPSEKTPACSQFIHTLLGEVFPEDEVAVLLGGRDVADALLELPFDHIFFTGSPAVGKKVMAKAAQQLASVTLELGGKSPVIVDETADLKVAAARIAWGKFINAGQTCVAPDYVLVQRSVASAFAEALRAQLVAFYAADTGTQPLQQPDFASLVDARSCARLQKLVEQALAGGAKLVIGGETDCAQRRMQATVLTEVSEDNPIMDEEIFGPVLPILSFDSLDEAIARVRARPKPLALYVFSRSASNTQKLLTGTSAGGTCINNTVVHLANPQLPFGGVGQSGMGNYHGRHGFETMSHARAVLHQRLPASTTLLFPPYGARARRVMALLRRIVG